jgi:hypothetical protein
MKHIRIASVALVCVVVTGCQQSETLSRRQASRGSAEAILNQGLSLQIQDNQLDAYDYTFGSQALQIQKLEDKGSSRLEITRKAFVASNQGLDEGSKTALTSLCQNIGLSLNGDSFTEASSLPADGRVYLHWRSHYSVQQKEQLCALLEGIKAPVRCLVRIQLGAESDNQFAFISLDPIPVEQQKLAGTAKVLEAVDEGLMLIDANPAINLNQGQLIPIESPADIKPKIAALHSGDIQAQLSKNSGAACRYHTLNGQTKVGNPTALRTYEYSVSSAKPYTLGTVRPQSISGRNLPACSKVKTEVIDRTIQADVACGDYRSIQDEGLEAGCQWSVEVMNANDPGNALGYNISMEKITFETVDVGTTTGAASVIPEAPNNPVRARSTAFNGFSATQLTSMEQAFDFWIGVSPKSYATHFDKYVTRVSYLGRQGPDCSVQGVLAYVVSLTSTEIFWCEAAGMSAAAITNQNSPLQILLIGVTAFHENLHTRGREHDFDAPQYQPCLGTAESALLSFDALKTCTDDYCLAFKDFALQEYKAELDYSLQGDARRFQGQCQIWNNALGLKATDFRT